MPLAVQADEYLLYQIFSLMRAESHASETRRKRPTLGSRNFFEHALICDHFAAPLGARFAHAISQTALRRGFAFFLALTALRMRIISMRLAVAVAVIGGIGPFVGSIEFVREERRRASRPASV